MKKQLLITGIVAMVATAAFAQGNINFKTSATKNTVFFATDGTTASLTPVPTTGQAGSSGTVNYEFLTAPTGTAALTLAQMQTIENGGAGPAGWTESSAGAQTYSGPGVVNANVITLPASAGGPAASTLLEVFAFTGTLQSPTMFGFSGSGFNGGTVTSGGITTSTGGLGWTQPTGDPNNALSTPGAMPTGAAGFGSIVLVPVPEPTTIALGGLGAAALLLFRRRK